MPLPNFILAGAPKAGTSSLWSYIRQHPDVFMPEEKELFYFDFRYDRGLDWYRRHFENHSGESAIGEATVWYMRWHTFPRRLHDLLPDAKLIFMLRNPIDRARSNFWHDFRDGKYSFTRTFSDFIRSSDRDDRGIISSGYYFNHFHRIEQYFDRSQFLILFFSNFKQEPVATVRSIYEFLDVDPTFTPDTESQLNVSWGFRYLDELRSVDAWLRRLLPDNVSSPLQLLWARSRHFRQLFWKKNARPPSMSAADRRYLRDIYKEHNEKLESYLGVDLSHWV